MSWFAFSTNQKASVMYHYVLHWTPTNQYTHIDTTAHAWCVSLLWLCVRLYSQPQMLTEKIRLLFCLLYISLPITFNVIKCNIFTELNFHVPWCNFWLVICIAKNLIWTTLKVIFSIFRFFLYPQIPYFQILSKPYINGKLQHIILMTGFVV